MIADAVLDPQVVHQMHCPESELRRLERRLEDGYRMIEAAAERGDDVRRWEGVWIRLLHDYERLYQEVAV